MNPSAAAHKVEVWGETPTHEIVDGERRRSTRSCWGERCRGTASSPDSSPPNTHCIPGSDQIEAGERRRSWNMDIAPKPTCGSMRARPVDGRIGQAEIGERRNTVDRGEGSRGRREAVDRGTVDFPYGALGSMGKE